MINPGDGPSAASDPPAAGLSRPTFYLGLAMWSLALIGGALLYFNSPRPTEPAAPTLTATDERGRTVAIQVDAPEVLEVVPDDWQPPLVEGWTLTDQNGQEVTPQSLRGKPFVAGFIFTRCQTHCPDLVRKMYDLNESIRDLDVRLLTVTVDPQYDTRERLAKYAEIYTADAERWKFLTGPGEEILKLTRFGRRQMSEDPPDPKVDLGPQAAHSLRLMHVDAEGRLAGSYHFRNEDDLTALRRVLAGKRETPEDNRPLPPMSVLQPPAGEAAAVHRGDTVYVAEIAADGADPLAKLPAWSRALPAVNATLNSVATLLLIGALAAIKSERIRLHRNLMFAALGVSVVFLGCYLTYHYALTSSTGLRGKPFEGTGGARAAYYTILWTHIPLAALVPVLAIVAVRRALAGRWEAHRRLTRWAFPIWMYVSVTGVIIYGMLYHWPAAVAA